MSYLFDYFMTSLMELALWNYDLLICVRYMHQIGQNVLFSNIDGVLSIKGHSIISIFPVITFLSFACGRPHAADANTHPGVRAHSRPHVSAGCPLASLNGVSMWCHPQVASPY